MTIPRNIKVRAYFHHKEEGVNEAGNAEVMRRAAPFPKAIPGEVIGGLVGVWVPSDQNYVRFDLPGLYETADAADQAASMWLDTIVGKS